MSDVVIVAVIAAFPSVISALLGVSNRTKLQEVHVLMNSRLDALLKATQTSAHMEGVIAERTRQSDNLRNE